MSEDPLGYAAGDTNLYRYCGNSPTNATDPSGRIVVCLTVGIAAAASLYYAAHQYDVASDVLATPGWTADDAARFNELASSAQAWHRTGNTMAAASIALAPGSLVFAYGSPLAIAGYSAGLINASIGNYFGPTDRSLWSLGAFTTLESLGGAAVPGSAVTPTPARLTAR